jgi:hypothetical protein
MGRGDLSDEDWDLLARCFHLSEVAGHSLRVIIGAFSMACCMCCGSAALGVT